MASRSPPSSPTPSDATEPPSRASIERTRNTYRSIYAGQKEIHPSLISPPIDVSTEPIAGPSRMCKPKLVQPKVSYKLDKYLRVSFFRRKSQSDSESESVNNGSPLCSSILRESGKCVQFMLPVPDPDELFTSSTEFKLGSLYRNASTRQEYESLRRQVLEEEGLVPQLPPDSRIVVQKYRPTPKTGRRVRNTPLSKFMNLCAQTIVNSNNARRPLDEVNKALLLVKQTPSSGDMDVISSMLSLVLLLTPSILWDDKDLMKAVRKTLDNIISSLTVLRKVSKSILKKCQKFVVRKDEILMEYGSNPIIQIHTRSKRYNDKQAVQDEVGTSMYAEFNGYWSKKIKIGDSLWEQFNNETRIDFLEDLLNIITDMLSPGVLDIARAQKQIKTIHFSSLAKIDSLVIKEATEIDLLKRITKRLNNSLMSLLHASATAQFGYEELYHFKSHLKGLRGDLRSWQGIPRQFSEITVYSNDSELRKYVSLKI